MQHDVQTLGLFIQRDTQADNDIDHLQDDPGQYGTVYERCRHADELNPYLASGGHALGKAGTTDGSGSDYEFEPDPTTILDTLLPRYVEARVYAALLNAAASEHAYRQRAMKSATDNADELIRVLTNVANRARQAEITTEISEISRNLKALAKEPEQRLTAR